LLADRARAQLPVGGAAWSRDRHDQMMAALRVGRLDRAHDVFLVGAAGELGDLAELHVRLRQDLTPARREPKAARRSGEAEVLGIFASAGLAAARAPALRRAARARIRHRARLPSALGTVRSAARRAARRCAHACRTRRWALLPRHR